MEKVEALKREANVLVSQNQYEEAREKYSQAIELDPHNSILHSNRSLCNLRLEAYGAAIDDATCAIDLNPSYAKAYYRRGSALFMLKRFQEAIRDLRHAQNLAPKSKDANTKLRECITAARKDRFEMAIHFEEKPPSAMSIPSDFEGPRLLTFPPTPSDVAALKVALRGEKLPPLRDMCQLLIAARDMLAELPTLIDVAMTDSRLTVVGDIHGQFYDLLHLFEINGDPSPTNRYVFTGDYVDRGSFSVEVLQLLLSYKLLYPDAVHLIRGNHETLNLNGMYGFAGEANHKYNQRVYELSNEIFTYLPLAALISGTVPDQERRAPITSTNPNRTSLRILCLHGGLFTPDGVTLDDIRGIDRKCQPADGASLMNDILWSDPVTSPGRHPSPRGVGKTFGPDISFDFCRHNQIDFIVRSHEQQPQGYKISHGGRVITVFSAPNYCDAMGNMAAVLRVSAQSKYDTPDFLQYKHVEHPPVPAMAYASGLLRMLAGGNGRQQ